MRRFPTAAATACVLALSSSAFAQDLAPPPPMNAPPAANPAPGQPTQPGQPAPASPTGDGQTTQKLDEAEQKDSGRNFELFYLDGKIGGSYINMSQFSANDFSIKKSSAGGPMFDIGAGIRLLVFVAGARLRYNALSSFNMWQINGELGLKIPISSLDLLFGLHGGYSFVGRLGDAGQATNTNTPLDTDAVSIRGFNAGLEFGLDYYVSSLFSVGAGVLGDFLLLNRPAVPIPASFTAEQRQAVANDPLYQKSGSSAGLQLAGGLRLGLHFGL